MEGKKNIEESQKPWPSQLATCCCRCIKWGFIVLGVGVIVCFASSIVGAVLEEFGPLSNIIAASIFIVGISSILFFNILLFGGLVLSLIALIGGIFRGLKTRGVICASCVFVFTLLVFTIESVVLYKLYIETQKTTCLLNMRELAVSYRWCDEEKDLFANKENWNDLVKPYLSEDVSLQCPVDKIGPCSYAMNENIPSDAKIHLLPKDLVIFFESSPGWNNVGGQDDVVSDRHHKYGAVFLFADGTFKFVPAEDIPKLRWTVENKSVERQ